MTINDGLTPKKRRAILALIASRTMGEASVAAGVSEKTLERWRKEPAFQVALRDAERQVFSDGLRMLLADQQTNLGTMMMLRQRGESDAVRLRAAQAIERSIQRRFSALAMAEIEERLEALEERLLDDDDGA